MLELTDKLTLLVGSNGWDYCVVWRINEDQRFLKLTACCCAGAETGNSNEQVEIRLSVSSQFSCRDAKFQHLRTQCCDLLSQLPCSVPLESRVYAEVFLTSQTKWLNSFTNVGPNTTYRELPMTRALIPVLGGLIELFAAKQVPEDQNIVDFIVAQCTVPLDEFSYPFHQLEDSIDTMTCDSHPRAAAKPSQNEELFTVNDLNDKEAVRPETGRSDSISDCSDQIDGEDDSKCQKRNGKGQAKNLEAERRRRKKLNERLYRLRALVPIISKLDKAAILVDAIEHVKQLLKQVEELQQELEHEDSDKDVDECGKQVYGNVFNPFVTGICGAGSGQVKVQQMEPKVEVALIEGSVFFIRVFCEQRPGGLVRLLEAFRNLGLVVVNVNVTSCRMLVSYVFQVENKGEDTDRVEADDLRNTLLELIRTPF